MSEAEDYDPVRYSFVIGLQCTSEEEVAQAMQKLILPITGLALDGINVTLMRMIEDESDA